MNCTHIGTLLGSTGGEGGQDVSPTCQEIIEADGRDLLEHATGWPKQLPGLGAREIIMAATRARTAQRAAEERNPDMARRQLAERQKRQQAMRYPVRASGIPGLILAAYRTREDEDGRPINTDAQVMVSTNAAMGKRHLRLLVLRGAVGTGKSMAAGFWLAPRDGLWVQARRIAEVSRRFGPPAVRELERMRKKPVVVIDELGREDDRDVGILLTYLMDRFDDGLITVATANMTPEEFGARYKAPVVRRVWARGEILDCSQVLCPGELARLNGSTSDE